MSFQIVKKTIDFCKKWPVQTGSSIYYYLCLDENKHKFSICNKDDRTYTCRFDELSYYHC